MNYNKKTIEDIDVAGKKVLVRCDFNVPQKDGVITSDKRIVEALPTIKYLMEKGAYVILCSHMGKPHNIFTEGFSLNKKEKKAIEELPAEEQAEAKAKALKKALGDKEKFSLKIVADKLNEYLGGKVTFASDIIGDDAKAKIAAMKAGECVLLENVRFDAREEKNDPEFAKELASLAEVYVNDAFGTAHRAHASTALMAEYFSPENKMFGYLMGKEVAAVDKVMKEMVRPFTAIMGGSKVSSKIDIIENLLTKVDNLIIAGGMTYTFTKALGGKIGNSICEDDKLDLALELINKAKANHVNLVLAVDAKIADDFSNDANTDFCDVDKIPDGWEGMDIGPKSEALFADVIKKSKTILWNGPTGVFEFDNFTSGSRAVAEAIVEATKNGAFSLVGGGDSVACVNKFGLADKVSYVSTGGGALLEAIEGKTLPGIAAIQG